MKKKLIQAQDLERLFNEVRRLGIYQHDKYSLSDADITLLFSVSFGDEKGIKPSVIAKRQNVTLPAITHKMNKLVNDGYLTRRESTTDKRVTYVLLTEKGKTFLDGIKEDYYSKMLNITNHLGERDTNALLRILKKINTMKEI